jgi:hypothetical protein
MPFYLYRHSCGYEELLERRVSGHILDHCPGCDAAIYLRPVLNRETVPRIMLSSVTNHVYNNGMGKYDIGLGKRIESRQQHRQIMRDMDVHEADSISSEEYIERAHKAQDSDKEIPIDHIKDRYEYYRAEVDKGRRREEAPAPEGWKDPKPIEGDGDA